MSFALDILVPNFIEIVLIIGLMLTIKFNSKIGKKVADILFLEIILVILLLITTDVEIYAATLPTRNMLRIVCSFIIYTFSPFTVMLLIRIVSDSVRLRNAMLILAGLNFLVYSTAFFSRLSFWYTEDNIFKRGPLNYSIHCVFLIYMIFLIIVVFGKFTKRKFQENAIMIYAIISNVSALALETIYEVHHIVYPTVLFGILIYYLYLHVQTTNDDTKEIQLKLSEQRSQLMLSQIQPHFLYNTLGTIQVLCKTDPDLAAETVETFSEYLRGNMKTINENHPIKITDEISHTKLYTKIEMLRFENIRIDYEIEDCDFMVPALSVQPLVENAIRHGVRARDEGIVRVFTYCRKNGDSKVHIVEIRDNGVGFDVNSRPKGNGMHIGLQNVRERIEKVSRGTMTINSIMDEGTTITIEIPESVKSE